MVSYDGETAYNWAPGEVLILIVVEDGLVPAQIEAALNKSVVLILIVVEDGLVPDASAVAIVLTNVVLILIVVEDGLVLDLIRLF